MRYMMNGSMPGGKAITRRITRSTKVTRMEGRRGKIVTGIRQCSLRYSRHGW